MTFNPQPGDHWISTTSGMSGYFAVEYWLNPDMGGFVEPYDTRFGRYGTREEAEAEAIDWAEEAGLPYIKA